MISWVGHFAYGKYKALDIGVSDMEKTARMFLLNTMFVSAGGRFFAMLDCASNGEHNRPVVQSIPELVCWNNGPQVFFAVIAIVSVARSRARALFCCCGCLR